MTLGLFPGCRSICWPSLMPSAARGMCNSCDTRCIRISGCREAPVLFVATHSKRNCYVPFSSAEPDVLLRRCPSGRPFESHWVFARMEMTRAASHTSSLAGPAPSFGYQRSQWYTTLGSPGNIGSWINPSVSDT